MKSKLFSSFFFLFLILLASSVIGVGLGVTPAYLDFEIVSENDFEHEIYVINNENQSFEFNLYSDSVAVIAEPNRFSLKGDENKRVKIKLNPAKFSEDFKATLFIVSSKPNKSDVKAGIKMPINVKASNKELLKTVAEQIKEETQTKRGEIGIGEEGITTPTGFVTLVTQPWFLSGIAFIIIIAVLFLLVNRRKKSGEFYEE